MTSIDNARQNHPRNDLALAEAALFLSPQPITRRALAKILGGVALAYVDQLWEDLKEQYQKGDRGIELHVEEGRAMLRVKAAYVNAVAHLAPQQDIPRPVLRTLAVIAYNHPMTQADLIKVRGNKGYSHVQELLDRGLITAEDHGRTLLLSVTKEFLRHFGLSSVEEFRFHFSASPDGEGDEDEQEIPDSAENEQLETQSEADSVSHEGSEDREAYEDDEILKESPTLTDDVPSDAEEGIAEDAPEEVEDG